VPGICVRIGVKTTHKALASPEVATPRFSLLQVGETRCSHDSFEEEASVSKEDIISGTTAMTPVRANRPWWKVGIIMSDDMCA